VDFRLGSLVRWKLCVHLRPDGDLPIGGVARAQVAHHAHSRHDRVRRCAQFRPPGNIR